MGSFFKRQNQNNESMKNKKLKIEHIIRHSKIKTRLKFSYGLLVLVPILVVGISSVIQSKKSMEQKNLLIIYQMIQKKLQRFR